jgi:uncharacterized membrane protein
MTPWPVLWIALGALAGVVHAVALWSTAHRWTRSSLVAIARVPVVVAVLIAAATARTLLPAVGGWATALVSTGTLLFVWSRR